MNIHEYQAKEILREFGAPVTEGIVLTKIEGIEQKISSLKAERSYKFNTLLTCIFTCIYIQN